MANIADRLGLTDEVRELKLGKSFGNNASSRFHTIRYDFKPASVDTRQMAAVDVGESNQVTVTVPHIEGSGTAHTVFKGSQKPYQKECVLIIDHITGDITLEKLSCNVQLKKTRAEGTSRIRSNTPVDNILISKKSPTQKSPQKHLWSSSNHYSPVQKCSPLPRSPQNSQVSPTTQTSPSMPCLVPPVTNVYIPRPPAPATQDLSMPFVTGGNNVEMLDVPDVGVLSSSSDSSSSSNSSSSGESSEEEEEAKKQTWAPIPASSNANDPAKSGCRVPLGNQQSAGSTLPIIPKFSQLSEDLKLSESDSD